MKAWSAGLRPMRRTGEIAPAGPDRRKVMKKLPFGDLYLEGFDGDHLLEKFRFRPSGRSFREACLGLRHAAPSSAPPASATTSGISTPATAIQRFRCWDTCMYSDFTHDGTRATRGRRSWSVSASGLCTSWFISPPTTTDMYSLRWLRALLAKCPISLNIVKVIKALGETGECIMM